MKIAEIKIDIKFIQLVNVKHCNAVQKAETNPRNGTVVSKLNRKAAVATATITSNKQPYQLSEGIAESGKKAKRMN